MAENAVRERRLHFERGVFEQYPEIERKTVFGAFTRYVTDVRPHGCPKRRVLIYIPMDGDQSPEVYADGPEDSPHRYWDPWGGRKLLCLWYPDDPPERKWRPQDGLLALLGMVRIHLTREGIYRRGIAERGSADWPGEEAPHVPR